MQNKFSEISQKWGGVIDAFSRLRQAVSLRQKSDLENKEDGNQAQEINVTDVPLVLLVEPVLMEGVHEVVDPGSSNPDVVEEVSENKLDIATPDQDMKQVPALEASWNDLLNLDAIESLVFDAPVASASNPNEKENVPVLADDGLKDQFVSDQDLVDIVVEELQELIPETGELLSKIDSGDKQLVSKLHRLVHTLKGTVGQVGAYRARSVIHNMETLMEELDHGTKKASDHKVQLLDMWDKAQQYIRPLLSGEWKNTETTGSVASTPAVAAPRAVRVNTDAIDVMIQEINETRLDAMSLEEIVSGFKHKLKDLEENSQRVAKMLRELELQAEMQIQSRRSQLQEVGEDFDPLEFDRFTRLQELSRLMNEGVTDILEVRRELTRTIVDQETIVAHQRRSILATQEKLHKTRLTPVDAINDRLHNVVWTTSREVGKDIGFELTGGRLELDRMLLEKIVGPLDHILRNSVAHGIEERAERISLGKSPKGHIRVSVRQEAGRAIIEVQDDGYGLRTTKIRQKAIEKGLWNDAQPMNDAQAAEMICTPGFSTADSVSQIAGRGVGMDAVRSEILSMGGRFEISSVPTKGLYIVIQIPTSIATASVLVVESGGERWAFPIEMVEHVTLLGKGYITSSRANSLLKSEGFEDWQDVPYSPLNNLTGVYASSTVLADTAPVLLLRERGRQMAVEVDRLIQVFEVPLRPAGSVWTGVKGVAGTVILPSGDAIFLVDPFRFPAQLTQVSTSVMTKAPVIRAPLVMVVDDSLTVRKATTRFLQKNGYDNIVAKDGQEALEMLLRIQPALILMDIEMPRMDGFDCLKNIKENQHLRDIPVVMVTSRTAEKHRRRAVELGADGYLGKPFKDSELLGLLQRYAPHPSP